MPRVIADVELLAGYVDRVAAQDRGRRDALRGMEDALEVFFASGSAFGPTWSPVVGEATALLAATVLDAYGVMATAAAFAAAEVEMGADPFGLWTPDDIWIEQRRRAWLAEHHPEAARVAAPTMTPAETLDRLRRITTDLERARTGGFMTPELAARLVAARDALLAEAVVAVDAVTDSINAWSGSDNDPVLDELIRERAELVSLLVAGDGWVAARMTALVDEGLGARVAFETATHEGVYEGRLREVMTDRGVDRAAAIEVVAAMDARIAGLIAAGHTAEESVLAFAVADRLDLDLGLASRRATTSGLTIADVLGRMAAAGALGLEYEELAVFEDLSRHFEAFDNATGGERDGRVSERDLLYVVDQPHRFLPAQVLAAQAILDEPILRNRLDTAAHNVDILDHATFGSTQPGDLVISEADLDAFLIRAQLNSLLGDHASALDTAADGGTADGHFSAGDLEAWLEDNPAARVDVRQGVRYMLDAGLVDQSWLESNREAFAMGAALVAGGVVIVVSGGAATPVVLAAGFAAGGAAAGLTTVGVNHLSGAHLTDGVLENAVNGGIIGFSVAGLPAAWTEAAAITGGLTVGRAGAVAGFGGEVAGIVNGGGIDLVLPDGWEDEIHDVAGRVEFVGGIAGLATDGLDGIIRSIDEIVPSATRTADDFMDGSRLVTGPFPDVAAAGEVLIRRNTEGIVTHYRVYNADGLPVMRVDLTGRTHGGIPIPHVQEYTINVNPVTGESFVNRGPVRPAEPYEVPSS